VLPLPKDEEEGAVSVVEERRGTTIHAPVALGRKARTKSTGSSGAKYIGNRKSFIVSVWIILDY